MECTIFQLSATFLLQKIHYLEQRSLHTYTTHEDAKVFPATFMPLLIRSEKSGKALSEGILQYQPTVFLAFPSCTSTFRPEIDGTPIFEGKKSFSIWKVPRIEGVEVGARAFLPPSFEYD